MLNNNIDRLQIHVVDDDNFMLDIARITLNRIGIFDINTSSNGRQFLNQLDHGAQINILLLDLNMPVMSGINVIHKLAERSFSGGIILFSNENTNVIRMAGKVAITKNLNILGALKKPATPDSMREMLERYQQQHNIY